MSTIVGFIAGLVVGVVGIFAISVIMINRDLEYEFKDIHEEDNE